MLEDSIEAAKFLFTQPKRELHYVGEELMLKSKRQWTEETLNDIYWFITTNSWWDSVDYIAAHLLGTYFKLFPDHKSSVMTEWNSSDNMLVVRSTILFQLNYKEQTDTDLLAQEIDPHKGQK